MAEAGLFYTGKTDAVWCFKCDQGLKSWEPTDQPWVEHALWNPGCKFVLEQKGQTFVDQVHSPDIVETPKNDSNIEPAKPSEDLKIEPTKPIEGSKIEPSKTVQKDVQNDSVPDDRLCTICCDQERSVVFLPCGHLTACRACSAHFEKCPNCRGQISGLLPVYF